jgi:predicted amidohydrolase
MRLAVAQNIVPADPYDPRGLQAAGDEIRHLMSEAAAAGARLAQFPEGSIVYPDKHVVSSSGTAVLGEADWTRAAWDVIGEQCEAIAECAGRLGIWTTFGAPHRLTSPNRPLNSYYIASDQGKLVDRYDKRFLSHTEISHIFTPGDKPLVFELDGFRFGTALCIEVQFPELFAEYERLDVDCVLVSTDGVATSPATIVQSYGAIYCYWIGFAVAAQNSTVAPSGIVAPGGAWLARCADDGRSGIAVADLDRGSNDPRIAVALQHARPWRRSARAGLYDARIAHGDPRSSTSLP